MGRTCVDISVGRASAALDFDVRRRGEPSRVDVRRKGKDIALDVEQKNAVLAVGVNGIGPSSDPMVSMICLVGVRPDGREVFMVKEGVFLVGKGEIYRVIKEDELSE